MDRLGQLISLARHARKHVKDLVPIYRFNKDGYCEASSMKGACGVFAIHLMYMANKRGMNPTFVSGQFKTDSTLPAGHCWIEYDKHIVDGTATQFFSTYNKVHVVHATNLRYIPNFKSNDFVKALLDLERWSSYPDLLKRLA